MRVKIFITGGTIDGLEYSAFDQHPSDHQTLIPELLQQARVTVPFEVQILMNKDSKFITDEDREVISENCRSCGEDNIVITHGTVTMADSAKYLADKKINKTIVFVGAMVPANQPKSDAMFNLGAAFVAASTLPGGYTW